MAARSERRAREAPRRVRRRRARLPAAPRSKAGGRRAVGLPSRAAAAVRQARRGAFRAGEGAEAALYTAEERATLAFFSVEGVGPKTLERLRGRFGTLAEALQQPADRIAPLLKDGPTRKRFRSVPDLRTLADRLFERAARVGARVLFPGRPGWPRQLAGLDFPPVLYVRGELDPQVPRVAVVGSRQTDEYGAHLAVFFADGLARSGVSVVSGGAKGVDYCAHRACLDARAAQTVAVLGSGVDIAYPGEHRELFLEIIARGGAVVSHFPPGTPGVPQNFIVRNKAIAALSDAVLVARASAVSGALGTAAAALALGRPLFAVPGDITSRLAGGVNALLDSGQARCCTSLKPIGAALGLPQIEQQAARPGRRPTARSEAPAAKLAARAGRSEVPDDLRPVWEALGRGPAQFEELLARCGLDAAGLASALLRLELLGHCQERIGKVFVRT